MQLFPTRPRRLIAFAIGATVAAGLFVAPQTVLAAPTEPPNPTDGQLSAAAAHKNDVANRVGQLSGQIAAAQQRLTDLQNAAALAEQKVAYRIDEYRKAVDRAKVAKTQQSVAVKNVDDAQRRFAQYMQATYMDGRPAGLTGNLLTADDPNALLQQSNYQQYEASHNAGVIGDMQRLTVARSNANARAKTLQSQAAIAKQKSIEAQKSAAVAVQNQTEQTGALRQSMAAKQTELNAAGDELARLNGQRATHDRFVEQERIRKAKIAEEKRRAAEQRRLEAIEREKREAAQRQRENNSGGGGGGGGGSSYNPPPQYNPPAPGNGGWTAAKAQRAVNRAVSTLGTPYAWAGGGASGPSYGACVPSAGAPYDCNIRGYDCSGLVMYAWGKGWDHYAATQYSQAGSYHPGRYNLKKGDLVFFSSNGTVGGIHHVALSLGGDRIIEAPYSGGYVQYNNISSYGDYYGATRPLT